MKSTGIITRVVGNRYPSYSGDGGSPIVAGINWPTGIAFDTAGSLYIADTYRIRKVAVPTAAPAPSFSLPTGTYTSAQTVTVTDAAAGATIYYTTDGTTPTVVSNVYTGPITVSSTQTLKAIATAIGHAQSPVTAAMYTIQLPQAPSMTVAPSSTSVTTAQAFTVTVVVVGASGHAVPTGTVTLNSGSYNAVQTLASGSTTFSLAAGALPTGVNTLTAVYAPDASSSGAYKSATQSATVTVTAAIGTVLPSITAVPSASTITDNQDVTVSVSVTGSNGQPTPTGSVSLVYGTYSTQQPLTGGAAILNIPAGTLTTGANSVTINYSGDATFSLASTSAAIAVSPVIITVPAPSTVSAGGNATGAVTLSAGSTYSGTMNLTCTLVASPAGAQSLPTCTLSPATLNIAAGGSGSSTLTVQTKAATTARSTNPLVWLRGGGVALAAILFFGLPAKRRPWMSYLGLFSLILFFGTIGCGGGGSPSRPPPTGTPATTAGTYTFNVLGTDAANTKIATAGSVMITVR